MTSDVHVIVLAHYRLPCRHLVVVEQTYYADDDFHDSAGYNALDDQMTCGVVDGHDDCGGHAHETGHSESCAVSTFKIKCRLNGQCHCLASSMLKLFSCACPQASLEPRDFVTFCHI